MNESERLLMIELLKEIIARGELLQYSPEKDQKYIKLLEALQK